MASKLPGGPILAPKHCCLGPDIINTHWGPRILSSQRRPALHGYSYWSLSFSICKMGTLLSSSQTHSVGMKIHPCRRDPLNYKALHERQWMNSLFTKILNLVALSPKLVWSPESHLPTRLWRICYNTYTAGQPEERWKHWCPLAVLLQNPTESGRR